MCSVHRAEGQQLAMALGQLIFGSMESGASFVRMMCSLTYEKVSIRQLRCLCTLADDMLLQLTLLLAR